jgi:hypothetical protein
MSAYGRVFHFIDVVCVDACRNKAGWLHLNAPSLGINDLPPNVYNIVCQPSLNMGPSLFVYYGYLDGKRATLISMSGDISILAFS